jgi:GH3 auxin-responsive promoter
MKSGIRNHRSGIRGAVDRILASRLETILTIAGSRLYKSFIEATKDVEKTQTAVRNEILSYAGDTVFGRKHNFSRLKTYEEFKSQIEIQDYEDLRPFIDRHASGEQDVLFPGKPMMYNRSSGTTMLPKLIPVTPYDFQKTIKDRGKLWLYGLLRHYPGIYKHKSFSVVSPAVEGHTADGTPFGSLSGVMRENIPEFMKLTHAVPFQATSIQDYETKIYLMLRFAVASDISTIFTGNPATVVNLATQADNWKEDLIRDIRDGTIKDGLDLSSEIRAEFEAMLSPASARAAELDRLANRNDRFRPADYWPNLRLIHTWKNGNTRLVLPKLTPWFRKETSILDFGYISSEILSADLMTPENDGSILQIENGFYEFSRFEDEYSANREFLQAHQLEVGQRYYIYITTFSGLYRYDMNDVIEVIGHSNQAPVVRFLFKGKGITSIQGEKLSEAQFIEAVGLTAKQTGMEHDFFIGYADSELSGYQLFIEFLGDYSEARIADFEKKMDQSIGQVNIEYASKLETKRLRPIEIVSVGSNFFSRYRLLRLSEGAHEGQIKWLHLSSTEATKRRLDKLRTN